jgi:DMSO/TMAO reductase YedYZ molybdopterin-dependent catalytic subunit
VVSAVLATTNVAHSQLSVVVDGTDHPITDVELANLPRDTARLVFHGNAPMVYEGVSLSAVLRAAGVRSDSLRGAALATRLVIEAADGYRIVLALSDLDPSLGGRRVLLANRVDGKSLPADEAPWRLVVVGDPRPSRSARQVVRIRVISETR